MSRPAVGALAEDLYTELAPLAFDDENQGWALLVLAGAACAMLQPIDDLTADTDDGPGWSPVMDIDRAPIAWLPWLAQFVGVTVNTALPDADQRAQVRTQARHARGTNEAIAGAAKPYLTGTRTVILRERDAGACPTWPAYGLTVYTFADETPPEDLPTTNLLPNGGFETDLASNATTWVPLGAVGTLGREAGGKFGDAAMRFIGTGAIGEGPALSDAAVAIVANKDYSLSAWVYSVGGGEQIQLAGTWYTAALGAPITAISTGPRTLVAGWQRLTVTGTAEPTAACILIQITSTAAVAYSLLYDGIQLEQQPVATPYVETDGAPVSRPAGQGPVGAALRSPLVKPAGIILNYEVIDAVTFELLRLTYPTFDDITSTFADFDDLRIGTP